MDGRLYSTQVPLIGHRVINSMSYRFPFTLNRCPPNCSGFLSISLNFGETSSLIVQNPSRSSQRSTIRFRITTITEITLQFVPIFFTHTYGSNVPYLTPPKHGTVDSNCFGHKSS